MTYSKNKSVNSKKTYPSKLILIWTLKTWAYAASSLMWSQTLPELIIWIIITCHITCILIKTLISSPLSNFLLVIKIKIIRAISLIIVWKCWWFLPSLLLVWLPSCLFPLSEWIFFYKKLNKIKILLVVMELTWASIIPDSLKGWDSWLSWKPWLLLAL